MSFRLKPGQETFEIMSGPDEGKKFVRGKVYQTAPAGYEDRFDVVGKDAVVPAQKPARYQKKTAVAQAPILAMDAEEQDKKETEE